MSIEILYNGQHYGNIQEPLLKSIVSQIHSKYENILSSFSRELNQSGGSVRIEILGANLSEIKTRFYFNDVPEELKERISQSLTK